MDMGDSGSMGGACKISMLWNWYTIDACFVSHQWHITSPGMFAGSCVGVVLLTMSLAFLRRLHRAYDAHVAAQQSMMRPMGPPPPSQNSAGRSSKQPAATRVPPLLAATGATASTPRRYSLLQQTIRAFLHMLQFAVAYFVMLLAMYYNGYIIISIFIGAFLGYFVFEWEAAASLSGNAFGGGATEVTGCCG